MTSLARSARLVGLVGLLCLLGLTACADDAQFTANYAPDFRRGASVSVLGVFKDGRMSTDAWDEVASKVSPALGATQCAAGYDGKLGSAGREVADAVDDYARANGITDDLLEQLAPAAGGDLILVVTVAGRPPMGKQDAPPSPGVGAAPPMSRGRPRGGSIGGPMARGNIDRNAFEVAASLYSVKERKSVGLLHMGYIGSSASDAVARFGERLRKDLGAASCAGWRWDGKVDPEKLKKLASE